MSHETPDRDLERQTTRTAEIRDAARELRPRVPGLVILCHPETGRLGETVALPKLASGQTVELSRLEPRFVAPGSSGPLYPLAEPHVSRRPLRLVPGPEPGGLTLDPTGSRTRVTLDGRPLRSPRAFSAAEVERGIAFVLADRIALLLTRLDPVPAAPPRFGLVGDSDALVRVRREIAHAAALDVPVLLRGETGTGKELVARALHEAGPRSEGPFLAVNLGALTPSLAASELFGATRGAYTGAERKKSGFFDSARGGTLFLDEVGAAPPEIQVMLLRALETREIRPVGSTETRSVDVHVVTATDDDLETAIAQGRFQASLLYRLAGYEIRLPPLRERRDDVARLLAHFLEKERTPEDAEPLPAEIVARLTRHDWPGNVRELRNAARRLAVARRLGEIDPASLETHLLRQAPGSPPAPSPEGVAPPSTPSPPPSPYRDPDDVDEEELLAALAEHRWMIQPTARALGVSRTTLYRLMDACPEIRKASDLEAPEIETALTAEDDDPDAAAIRLQVSPQGLKRRMRDLGLPG